MSPHPDGMLTVLDMPLLSLNLGVRALTCLEQSGVRHVGDLVPEDRARAPADREPWPEDAAREQGHAGWIQPPPRDRDRLLGAAGSSVLHGRATASRLILTPRVSALLPVGRAA